VVFPNIEYSANPINSVVSLSEYKKQPDEIQMVSENIEKPDSYILNGRVDLNTIKGSDYSLLIKRFDNELKSRWKLFEKKQPLREIQSFAQEIVTLGRSFKLDFLAQYGEQLLSTIENFDVEEMRLKLDYFPDLLKQLKKIGHENK
jgi:hypothetical protein